jgi:hypothetical protein
VKYFYIRGNHIYKNSDPDDPDPDDPDPDDPDPAKKINL